MHENLDKIFCVLGCQGVRTPCHKGYAPFLKGVKGDRRVTGCTSLKVLSACESSAFR